MPDDAELAFSHPERRAIAMGGPNPPDRLSLHDYVVSVEIGAFEVERGALQRLRFNVAVELEPQGEAGDDVDLILSYDRLTEAIDAEVAAERLNLLETLSERIATRILREPQAARVFLRIEKLDRGPYALGVEIVRSKSEIPSPDTVTDLPAPSIHILAPGRYPTDIARAEGPALIVALISPGQSLPEADTEPARLRIGLLELEQAAWALASRHRDLALVATRTELDWATRQRKIMVWAPSKLVLDTPGAPQSAEGEVLAFWLADHLGAARIVVHGDVAIPADCRVPVERA
ncbi:MAG: dihydroneopterin aldolase [Rhodobacteraceae bacterium]|nr:dihydroneopterin aldolase [Paracoccaceae bacterium]